MVDVQVDMSVCRDRWEFDQRRNILDKFRAWDKDGDSRISLADFRKVLRRLDEHRDWEPVLDTADVDRDGFIDLDEFLVMVAQPDLPEPIYAQVALSDDDCQPPFALARAVSAVAAQERCSICLVDFWEPAVSPCGHRFCFECIRSWLTSRRNCPLCRFNLSLWRPGKKWTADEWDGWKVIRSDWDQWQAAKPGLPALMAAREAEARLLESRAEELMANGEGFALKIGFTTAMKFHGDGHSDGDHGDYVIDKVYVRGGKPRCTAALGTMIREVRFETFRAEEWHWQRVMDYATAPPFEKRARLFKEGMGDCFRAHVIWKEGAGLDPLTVVVEGLPGPQTRLGKCRNVFVPFPESAAHDANMRGSWLRFKDACLPKALLEADA